MECLRLSLPGRFKSLTHKQVNSGQYGTMMKSGQRKIEEIDECE